MNLIRCGYALKLCALRWIEFLAFTIRAALWHEESNGLSVGFPTLKLMQPTKVGAVSRRPSTEDHPGFDETWPVPIPKSSSFSSVPIGHRDSIEAEGSFASYEIAMLS
jgi:hypothetical protein